MKVLNVGHCGDFQCNCVYTEIRDGSKQLWESSWITAGEQVEVEQLRAETKAACEKFGLKCSLEGHPTDWEGKSDG